MSAPRGVVRRLPPPMLSGKVGEPGSEGYFTTRNFTIVVMTAGLIQVILGKAFDASTNTYMVRVSLCMSLCLSVYVFCSFSLVRWFVALFFPAFLCTALPV